MPIPRPQKFANYKKAEPKTKTKVKKHGKHRKKSKHTTTNITKNIKQKITIKYRHRKTFTILKIKKG